MAAFAWFARAGELDQESDSAERAGDVEGSLSLAMQADEAFRLGTSLLGAIEVGPPRLPRGRPDPIGLA